MTKKNKQSQLSQEWIIEALIQLLQTKIIMTLQSLISRTKQVLLDSLFIVTLKTKTISY